MPEPDDDKLTPADPRDLAEAIAFALRYRGEKRVHQADEYMAQIAAERIVEHLARARFVVMKKPPESGGAVGARFPTVMAVRPRALQSFAALASPRGQAPRSRGASSPRSRARERAAVRAARPVARTRPGP
jgi:hypothetical protein